MKMEEGEAILKHSKASYITCHLKYDTGLIHTTFKPKAFKPYANAHTYMHFKKLSQH